jgi:penicillin amidase
MKKMFCLFLALGLITGCGDDGDGPTKIEDLEVMDEIQLSGLSATVDVVLDDRGVPHIYGESETDVLMVQGYLMARDRMAQMEFLRRAVEGKIAELVGSVDASRIESDKAVRVLGFHRQAQAGYDLLESGSQTKEGLDAFAAGVTAYIDKIRAGEALFPGDLLNNLLRKDILEDWSAVDTLAMGRILTYDLSYSGWAEMDMTEAALGIQAAFPPNDPDERLAKRAPIFHDFWNFAPAEDAITKVVRSPGNPGPENPKLGLPKLPSREILAKARKFRQSLDWLHDLTGGPGGDRGSNNWTVLGSKTASGHAMMVNDPHLGLDSPPTWWYVHLNTLRAGGTWDVQGVTFAGIPAVILGYNRHIAWGATVTNYDVSDVYHETITAGGGPNPHTVLFNGQDVPIEKVREVIKLNIGDPVEFDVEVVPHHGAIIPDTRTDTEALTVRWTGNDPIGELDTFLGLNRATTLDEAKEALKHFEVGSQNWNIATVDGDIYWSTQSKVPIRDPRALTYDPVAQTGYCPVFVLPGTGEYEWTGYIPDEDIPTDLNPESGSIATANQDGIGTSLDGNPFNDQYYLGWEFDVGHRMARIDERLTEMTTAGGITPEDMKDLQAEHRSAMGVKLAGTIVSALDRAEQEHNSSGTHPDLTAAVTEAGAKMSKILDMRDRLAAWTSFDTPAAVEGDPSDQEIADSVATTIFNAILPRLINLAFGDEADRIGVRPGSGMIGKTIQWAMLEPERLLTYDATLGDTILWDDLETTGVEESRDDRILRAAVAALDFLEGKLGTDMDQWRWGKLHTIRFKTLIPVDELGGPAFDIFSIPPLDDPDFPDGFPRHGDWAVPDACNFSLWSGTDYSYSSGPSQRVVAVMTPEGPQAWNALPGGQQHDPEGSHHADEAELWRKNEAPPMYFFEEDVVKHAEERIQFTP